MLRLFNWRTLNTISLESVYMKKEVKFEENKLLNVFCIIGCILFILIFIKISLSSTIDLPIYFEYNKYLVWPVTIIGTYLTYNDAVKIRAGSKSNKEKTFNIETWSPITWTIIVFILYPFSLPYYIYKRNVIYEKN